MNSISRMPPRESGAALGLVADLAVQLPQALEDAVVQVAPIDEGRDQAAQLHRAAALDAGARRDDAALQPGEALPLAALDEEVLLQHRHAHRGRTGVAVGAQRQVDAEDLAVLGHVADQRRQPARELREIFVRRDPLAARAAVRALGLAVVLVDVDQVDVGRDIQLPPAELAHAHDPEVDVLADRVARRAVQRVELRAAVRDADVQRHLGQVGHRLRDVGHRRALLDVEHRQPLHHQLAHHAQRGGQRTPAFAQAVDDGAHDRVIRQAGRQQGQFGRVTAADALNESAVVRARGRRRNACRISGCRGN